VTDGLEVDAAEDDISGGMSGKCHDDEGIWLSDSTSSFGLANDENS
jgi:hypothetical protein